MSTQTPNLKLTQPQSTDTISSTITALSDNFGTIDSAITTNQSNISTLQSQMSNVQTKQTADESDISSNSNAISALQSQMSTVQSKQTTDEQNIASNTQGIATNANNLTAHKTSSDHDSHTDALYYRQSVVDQKINAVTATKVIQSGTQFPDAPNAVGQEFEKSDEQNVYYSDGSNWHLTNQGEFDQRGLNVKKFGAKGDGVTDDTNALLAAVSAINNAGGGELIFPNGTYNYSSTLAFTSPVRIRGMRNATLNYTGNSIAVKMGPDGLTSSNYLNQQLYEIRDITLSGGANMTNGLYFNNFVTMPRIIGVSFLNFGNPNAWGVFFQCNNWDILMQNCNYNSYDTSVTGRPWVCVNGYDANGNADNGNSRLRMVDCLGTPQAGSQVGVFLNGANNLISNCKLEGFVPNVMLGQWSNYSRIIDTYFEAGANAPAVIQFGSPATGRPAGESTSALINGVIIQNCYANVHNTDSMAPNAYFIGPTTAQSGIQNARVINNDIGNCTYNRELINLNNLTGQTGNVAVGNSGSRRLVTEGANVSLWTSMLQQGVLNVNNMRDAAMYSVFQSGLSAEQNVGIQYKDNTGTVTFQMDETPFKYLTLQHRGKVCLQVDPNNNVFVPNITLTNTASLPTAGAGYRGQILLVEGNGTSTADTAYMCLQSATGTYSWKQIISG